MFLKHYSTHVPVIGVAAGLLLLGTLAARPAAAQNASPNPPASSVSSPKFEDVPKGHWAYASLKHFRSAGILPPHDGVYGGAPALTRYEFAVGVARILMRVEADLEKAQPWYQSAVETKVAGFSVQSDVDELKKLIREFGPEMKELGVDLDAGMKAAEQLGRRVGTIEKRMLILGS